MKIVDSIYLQTMRHYRYLAVSRHYALGYACTLVGLSLSLVTNTSPVGNLVGVVTP